MNPNGRLIYAPTNNAGAIELIYAQPFLSTDPIEGANVNALLTISLPYISDGSEANPAPTAVIAYSAGTRRVPLSLAYIGMENAAGTDGAELNSANTALDDVATGSSNVLRTESILQAFDGTAFDRIRSASAANQLAATKTAPLQSASPGTWGIVHTPAVTVQATITRAAGAAGVSHVCTAISAVLLAPAATASGVVQLNLRDGATGAGTILKSWTAQVGGATSIAVDRFQVDLSGLQLIGTAATAMTLEFSAGGGAGTFESVSLEGYDIA